MKFDYIPSAAARATRLNTHRIALVFGFAAMLGVGAARLVGGGGEAIAETPAITTQLLAVLPVAAPVSGRLIPVSTTAATANAGTAANTAVANPALANHNFDGIIQNAVSDAMAPPKASEWTTVTIRPGQNLSAIFLAMGLPDDELAEVLSLGGDARTLKKLRAGDEIHIHMTGEELEGLTYSLDARRTLEIRRGDKGLEAVTLTADLERKEVAVAGVIRSSLFVDGRKANLSAKQIYEFAKLFEYDIDFAQDLHPGDRFSVVYEVLYAKGKKVKGGDILAAEFVNQGQKYRAVRFTARNGDTAYYTPQGQSLRKGFMRTPVDFARISSPFNPHRLHPILHTIRAHKGVDYAASIGTPIKTTGDGTVSFYGMKNGYGRVAMVKHAGGVETLYGHMSRFRPDLHEGSKVRMGQVIGYVGMSGLATAPHLHYEFRIDGIHKDPVTVPLPRANPVEARYMAQFRAQAAPMVAALETATTRLAQR